MDCLTQNTAENSTAEISIDIMNSLNGETPLRITDIPYIRKEHHELSSEVFKRKSIGSFSNCGACHQASEKDDYDDDYVKIPKE